MTTAIITGGARRVGRETALYLASCGYDIALHYNSSETEAIETKKEVEAKGVVCRIFQLDLHLTDNFQEFFNTIKNIMPDCEVLINNASVIERGMFLESSEDIMDEQFAINFKAPVLLTQAFAKIIGKGSVINILDTNITRLIDNYFMYHLSKQSLHSFTLLAAKALAPDIRVNAVCPGTVLPDKYFGEDKMEELRKRLPSQSLASVADIARSIQLLIENQHLNGQIIFADGGQHLI